MRGLRLLATLSFAVLFAIGCSKEVNLGIILSDSGEVSEYSDSVRRGIELAIDEVNASGEIGTLIPQFRDDGSDPDAARAHARELIEANVSAIVGGISSNTAIAIAEVAQAEKVVLLSPSASSPEYSKAGMYIFRNFPSDVLEGTAIAEFARELGLESVAVFALDNDYGRGLRNIFVDKFENKYRKVVGDFDFESGDEGRLTELIDQVVELKPDGVYIVGYSKDILDILRMLQEQDVKAVRMASGSVTPRIIEQAGQAAEQLIYPQPNTWDADSKSPNVASFVDAYKAAYEGEVPDIYAAHGYDAIKLIADSIQRGGSGHRDHVFVGMTGVRDFQGAAGRTVFDESGDVVRFPRVYIVADGAAKPYDAFVEAGGSVFRR